MALFNYTMSKYSPTTLLPPFLKSVKWSRGHLPCKVSKRNLTNGTTIAISIIIDCLSINSLVNGVHTTLPLSSLAFRSETECPWSFYSLCNRSIIQPVRAHRTSGYYTTHSSNYRYYVAYSIVPTTTDCWKNGGVDNLLSRLECPIQFSRE